jgi:predicted TIM-barrel fold metal-dependent hydrolase
MGTYNPWARLADMDCDQIDVAVVYPTDELPLTVTPDAGFAAARARAYNDWLYDYCEVCPQRLKGIGLVALQDVEGAIAEMHRAVSRLNMAGIQIGCTVREDTLLSDARLTDFWAEAERLNVAVAVHGPALPSLFRSYFDLNRPDHMLEASHMAHTFAQMLACSNIITSGILERFRNLRIAFLEAGAGWVPYWMHRMDEYNEVAPERWAHISAKPSEYIKSGRVFFSCEPGDEFIPFFIDHVGEDAMLFASDYLHFDALFVGEKRQPEDEPYPGTVATLLGRKDVPDSAKRKMLLDNSLNFYSMDKATLGRRGAPVTRPEPDAVRQATMPGSISAR